MTSPQPSAPWRRRISLACGLALVLLMTTVSALEDGWRSALRVVFVAYLTALLVWRPTS